MLLLAEAAPFLTPATVLIGLVGSGGVVGTIVAVVKLRGDADSQAVSQAEGAMEVMHTALEAVRDERDYWRGRFEKCHSEKATLLAERLSADRDTSSGPPA